MIKEKLYEGKAKILYPTDDPEIYLAHYKNDATAFNAQKRGQIQGKGEINCTIASALFQWLESLEFRLITSINLHPIKCGYAPFIFYR